MAHTEVDEKQLVVAYQAGDEHAFDAIVRTQWKALFAHALRRLNDPESAEDAVQDTLLRAYRALPSFSGDLALRAWLHRILTNVCYDEGNRRRRYSGLVERVQNEPQVDVPDIAEEAILHDTVRVMASALQDLPETYREALVLRYVDGLSFKEVAEATGISEENARARVHRGRQALSKVLSRIAVIAGFLVPGLRRASQQTPTPDPTAVANPDHVSLVTQLTSHAINAAPTVSRLAAEASALPSGKSALLTGAIAAAAAVTVGGTAYTVHEVTQPAHRPPAATAAPFAEKPAATTTTSMKDGDASAVGAIDADVSTTTTPFESTSSTLPPSAARPFATGPGGAGKPEPSSTTTTPPTSTPAPESGPLVQGTLGGDELDVTGARPDFNVRGRSILQGDDGATHAGQLTGQIYVADHVGGDASTELTLTLDDGRVLRVRFRGTLDRETTADGAPTWTMSGRYSIPGGAALGIAENGTATVMFRDADGEPSSLSFDLQGHQPTS